jgi:hypothetical protein
MEGIVDHMIKRAKCTINTLNGFRFCNKNCAEEEAKFICGSDGSLYRNYCEMKKAHCGRHVYQVCEPMKEGRVGCKIFKRTLSPFVCLGMHSGE